MGVYHQKTVINMLSQYLASNNWLDRAQKKNSSFARSIQALTENNISFGQNPHFFVAGIQGNCTASGESTFGDTVTKRTISLDFDAGVSLYIAPENTADRATCDAAVKYLPDLNIYSRCYLDGEAERIAAEHGKFLAKQHLSDLDFSMKEYRLNRFHRTVTRQSFSAPIWPIFAEITKENGKSENVHIGWWYQVNGEEFIDFDMKVPMTNKKKWIMAATIAAAFLALIALLFFL